MFHHNGFVLWTYGSTKIHQNILKWLKYKTDKDNTQKISFFQKVKIKRKKISFTKKLLSKRICKGREYHLVSASVLIEDIIIFLLFTKTYKREEVFTQTLLSPLAYWQYCICRNLFQYTFNIYQKFILIRYESSILWIFSNIIYLFSHGLYGIKENETHKSLQLP